MEYENIHIGKLVRKVCYEKRITGTDLGRRIGMSGFTGRNIGLKPNLPITKLRKVCKVLDHDFFQYLLADGFVAISTAELDALKVAAKEVPKAPDVDKAILLRENEVLKDKVAHLEEINDLLREKTKG